MNTPIKRFFSLTLFLMLSIAFSNVCEVKAQINESKAYYKTSINKGEELHEFYKAWYEDQELTLEKYKNNKELIDLENINVILDSLAKSNNKLIATVFEGLITDLNKEIVFFTADKIKSSMLAVLIDGNIGRYRKISRKDFFKEVFKANKNDYKNNIQDFYNQLNSFDIDSLFEEGLRVRKEKDAASK